VQKQIIDKKLTEEELAKTVKNASSNTELAKKLVAQGKITIDAKKKYRPSHLFFSLFLI